MRARDTPRARARRGARSTSECARSNEHSVLSAARACTTFDTLSGCLKGTSRVSVAFHRERFNGQIRIRSRVVIRRRVPFTFARTRRSSRASLTRRARALLSRVAPVVVVAVVGPVAVAVAVLERPRVDRPIDPSALRSVPSDAVCLSRSMFTSSDALSPLRTATPFAASAIEGKRRRATLSDAENLAVGAFGGIVETCVQSASPSPTPRGVAKSDNLPAFSFIRPSHRARARLVLLILLRPRPPSDHHAVLLFVATSY